jgi:hypothetical protein
LYEGETLRHWGTRYPDNVRWNFENLLLKRLKPKELDVLRAVRLEFPVAGEITGSPMEFYSYPKPASVVLPILSIKFLDDVSIASAWLELHEYSQESLLDYVAMLKYRSPMRFPGGRFPPPMMALQVPDRIWETEKDVDDLSQKLLKSSLVWIMAHELGHILYGHPGYGAITAQQAQRNEVQADGFATDLFRRIGTPPVGMGLVFIIFAHLFPHRGDFADERAWKEYVARATHPLSTQRLRALAQDLRASASEFAAAEPKKEAATIQVQGIAQQLDRVAKLLADSGLQQFMRARGMAATVESLGPRRVGEISVSGSDGTAGFRDAPPWQGVYAGAHARRLAAGGEESLACVTVLTREGRKVTGRFGFGLGEGVLSGDADDDSLRFVWELGEAKGSGRLEREPETGFVGTWGYGDSRDNGGTWTGMRNI